MARENNEHPQAVKRLKQSTKSPEVEQCPRMPNDDEVMRVWKTLADKQDELEGEMTFRLDETLLNDLGFNTDKGFEESVKKLPAALDHLQKYRWFWEPGQPLYGKGSPPTARIEGSTLVILSKFSEGYRAFVRRRKTS